MNDILREWFRRAEKGEPAQSKEEKKWRKEMEKANEELALEFMGMVL